MFPELQLGHGHKLALFAFKCLHFPLRVHPRYSHLIRIFINFLLQVSSYEQVATLYNIAEFSLLIEITTYYTTIGSTVGIKSQISQSIVDLSFRCLLVMPIITGENKTTPYLGFLQVFRCAVVLLLQMSHIVALTLSII